MEEKVYYNYFIESHLKDQDGKINIDLKDSSNKLELIKSLEKEKNNEEKFLISIYKFKIRYYESNIELTDKKENKFDGKIEIDNKERDHFIFDFKFDIIKKMIKNVKPPKAFSLNRREQFDIYYEILQKYYTEKNNKIYIIIDMIYLLKDYNDNLEFSIFLSILKEAISSELVLAFLAVFNLSKVNGIGILEDAKIKDISEMLNFIENTYDIILDVDEEKKDEYITKLLFIILYFNYVYNSRKIFELLNNEKNNQYYYKILIKHKNFFDLILDKKHISNLINISKNFDELNIALRYCNDVNNLIEIVIENYSKFTELYRYSSDKIEINDICKPKKEDNLKKIIESYNTLYLLQKEDGDKFFFEFNNSFIDKYIDIGIKFDDLILFKKMLNDIGKKNNDIDKLYHKNGLVLIINGKLKNMEIINFFKLNNYYNNSNKYSSKYQSLHILNGLDINCFDEQFYLEWKKIKWKDIFEYKYKNFIKKILDLVNDMKYFNILFKLLDESENNLEYDFNLNSLDGMMNKFIQLMEINKPKDFNNYVNDLVLLITYSDIKKNMCSFLSMLRGILDVEIVLKIYINIIINYNNIISTETRSIIINYFTSYLDKISPTISLNLILFCPQLLETIFTIIGKFTIQKKDIFQVEESEKLTLFKGLLNEKYLEKEEYKNNEYFINSLSLLNQIKKSIEINEITYNDIYLFYNKNEQRNEPLLLSRLKLIFLNEEGVEHYMNIIDKNYNEINNILNDLELILNNFKNYYANEESENIKLLEELINNIKNSKFNNYKNNYSDKYNKFISNYKNKAMERALKEKSLFFKIIFNNKQLLYEDDNESCINETIKSFDSLKYIFIKEDINLVDKKILKVCLNEIKDMKKEDINKEISILENIFEKEINNIDYDVEEITDIFIYTINNLILNDKLKDSFNKNIDIKDKIKEDGIRTSNSKKTKIKKNKNIIFKKTK